MKPNRRFTPHVIPLLDEQVSFDALSKISVYSYIARKLQTTATRPGPASGFLVEGSCCPSVLIRGWEGDKNVPSQGNTPGSRVLLRVESERAPLIHHTHTHTHRSSVLRLNSCLRVVISLFLIPCLSPSFFLSFSFPVDCPSLRAFHSHLSTTVFRFSRSQVERACEGAPR